jgi:hypothetical protein
MDKVKKRNSNPEWPTPMLELFRIYWISSVQPEKAEASLIP